MSIGRKGLMLMENSPYKSPLKLTLKTAIIVVLLFSVSQCLAYILDRLLPNNVAIMIRGVMFIPFLLAIIIYPVIVAINSQDFTRKLESNLLEGKISQNEYDKYRKEKNIAFNILWLSYTILFIVAKIF